MSSDLKQTPLYQNYVDRGAKIVEFGGWAMPVQFSSIKEEHNAVRYEIGLFDVSHMGEIEVTGKDASQFVQYLLSNDTDNLTTSKALYTALCNEEGGIIDDLVIYKLADDNYLLVVNAANTEKDFNWILKHKEKFDVEVQNVSNQYGQLAIQGPKARDLINQLVDEDVTEMKCLNLNRVSNYLEQTSFYLSQVTQVKMGLKFIVISMILKKFGMVY
ncbi:Aminomethyltransferase (glycine cleavage system T protein) [Staphylococcus aureus]|uniref:Aminomethyltransferase (Glycine cleavage system T protein) n=1 Tax=Staphylococcus aureus TaxID=1280 RepID=A0A380EI97_STAAU|nr:Aminomethyltransferase (glycine cleavage system T protein) [Staphylococcus aureus]